MDTHEQQQCNQIKQALWGMEKSLETIARILQRFEAACEEALPPIVNEEKMS